MGPHPILFPDFYDHVDIANRLEAREQVISAGIVRTYTEETSIWCGGDSTTLGVKSRGNEDARLIDRLFVDRI